MTTTARLCDDTGQLVMKWECNEPYVISAQPLKGSTKARIWKMIERNLRFACKIRDATWPAQSEEWGREDWSEWRAPNAASPWRQPSIAFADLSKRKKRKTTFISFRGYERQGTAVCNKKWVELIAGWSACCSLFGVFYFCGRFSHFLPGRYHVTNLAVHPALFSLKLATLPLFPRFRLNTKRPSYMKQCRVCSTPPILLTSRWKLISLQVFHQFW